MSGFTTSNCNYFELTITSHCLLLLVIGTLNKDIYMHGTKASFVCFLQLVGVGYKANTDTQRNTLVLRLGFSHDVVLLIPPSVRVFCLRPTLICCVSTDLQNVTLFAAKIKSMRPPEVYKAKGIRYRNETIMLKQGKKK